MFIKRGSPLKRFSVMFLTILVLAQAPAEDKTYGKWLDCEGIKIPVENFPAAEMDGIKCYPSPHLKLVFVKGVTTVYCPAIGPDWQLEGFVYGAPSPESEADILLYKIKKGKKERYFDIKGRKEAFRLPEPKDKVVVADTPPEE